jgi:hypothetical protein
MTRQFHTNWQSLVPRHGLVPLPGLTASENPLTLLRRFRQPPSNPTNSAPMLPSFLKQMIATILRPRAGTAPYWAGLRLPGGWFAQTRCARHIDATTQRVAAMGIKITGLSNRLHARSVPGLVDADRSLRRMLNELKEELTLMRRDLARWHNRECAGRAGKRLEAAIARLNRVNADTCAAADALLIQIEEYDARAACLR